MLNFPHSQTPANDFMPAVFTPGEEIRSNEVKRSDDEQLTDEIIGEAALSLLNSNSAINTRALVARLEAMLISEQELRRRNALQKIIAEIEGNISQRLTGKTEKKALSGAVKTQRFNEKNVH